MSNVRALATLTTNFFSPAAPCSENVCKLNEWFLTHFVEEVIARRKRKFRSASDGFQQELRTENLVAYSALV